MSKRSELTLCPAEPPLASLEEFLGQVVVQALGYTLWMTQLCNAVLALQVVLHDPDLLFG